jgi:hypothetical protein
VRRKASVATGLLALIWLIKDEEPRGGRSCEITLVSQEDREDQLPRRVEYECMRAFVRLREPNQARVVKTFDLLEA